MIALAVAGFVLLPLTAARAQDPGLRDPFDPILSAEDAATSPTEPDDATDPVTVTEPDVLDPDPASDGLPSTGQDPRNWLAVAYVLVAAGGALVALPRLTGERRRL